MVVLVAASSCATTPRFGGQVSRVTSPNFDAIGDVSPHRLEVEVRRLETLFDVFTLFFGPGLAPTNRLRVVVMNAGEPAEFIEGAGGFVTTEAFEPLIITSVAEDLLAFSVNTHELVHAISRRALPWQPRWFAEGIAGLFEDATFERDGSVKMGRWSDVPSWASLDDLFSWNDRIPSQEETGRLYATARALLFYLANRDEPRLQALLEALRQRQSSEVLLERLFPRAERPELLERMKAFVAEGKYSAWSTRGASAGSSTREADLAAWEVLLWRSRLFFVTGHRQEARAALDEATRLAPMPRPPALVAERVERERLVDDAELVDSPLVHLALAESSERSLGEQLAAAAKATERLPTSGLAAHRHAVALRKARRLEAALAESERAASLAPTTPEPIFEQARILSLLGQCARARSTFSMALAATESPDPGWLRQRRGEVLAACEDAP
jgi:tetratricopeptide (TPR) repeat protein